MVVVVGRGGGELKICPHPATAGWPCDITLHAVLRNKNVCSGSRLTSSTVMRLQGYDNRGGSLVQNPLADVFS